MPSRPTRPPSSTEPPQADSSRDADEDEEYGDERPPLERTLTDLFRRGLEAGQGRFGRVSESFFPRDIAATVVAQLGDIRSGVVKAVAQEVGRFLREADIASEVRKVLTGMDVEASVRLRFTAREDGTLKPSVDVKLGDDKGERRSSTPNPPEPDKR